MPRIVAGGQITLPPGYTLPPGWAVIPAQNVQIIPPQPTPPTTAHAPTPPSTGQGLDAGVQGPPPIPAGSPVVGSGDVTIPQPNDRNDHVSDQSNNAIAGTNIPASTSVHPTNQPQSSPNQVTQQAGWTPNTMPRTAPRVWAMQSPHPSFPIAVPLFPTAGNMGIQYRSPAVPAAIARTDGTSSGMGGQLPRLNGESTSEEGRDTEDHLALLNQMGESVRTMQELVSRMSTLIPPQIPISPAAQTRAVPPPSATSRQPSTSEPTTANGHPSDAKLSRTPTPLIIRKRRSFSPTDRLNENDPHPHDRLHRISSEEEDLSPEELADIRAPWVDQTLDPFDPTDLPPLPDVGRSRQGSLSPPRMRSGSQSPHRTLVRRGSLLKHDITNEVLDEQSQEVTNMAADRDRKGKGKEVYVEDGSDEE